MSATVDQRIVEMKFDNRQFESNVRTSMSTIDKLKESLDFTGATKGLDKINDTARNIDFSKLTDAVDQIGSKFTTLGIMGVTAIQNITNSALNAAKRFASSLTIDPITSGFKEYETQMNAVQTILANTQSRQKAVTKDTADGIKQTAKTSTEATKQANKDALDNLKDVNSKKLKEHQKLADEELDVMKDAYDEQFDLMKDIHDEEVDALEDKYEKESDALDEAIKEENRSLKKAHEDKLGMWNEEYMARLKTIDEQRYNKIKAVEDEIEALNEQTRVEEKLIEQQEQAERIAKLQEDIAKATTADDRLEAEKRLAKYEEDIARKQLLKQRKETISALEERKDYIDAQYDKLEENAKAEYKNSVELENELYNIESEKLKESQTEREKFLKETYKLDKELLAERQKDEKEYFTELRNAEIEALREKQADEKEALKERLDNEIDAMNRLHSMALENIENQNAAASEQKFEMTKASSLEDVNRALDELNEYADKTIYNFTEMTRNIGTFTAAGIDLDTSVSAIKGIANLAAVSGSNSQQASTAMYQLSQALAGGTVRLMDWNSVVNAGMGGMVFQDALKETARVHGVAIDNIIASEGSFRESLSTGWLSADILTETLSKFTGDLTEAQILQMGYTKEQAAEIIKLGDIANKAATEVKTATQLMDTLKEAAGSGWAQSWRFIIGDFGEAKALWTEMSNVLGKIIGDAADARNAILSGGLSTGWKQFIGKGIADVEGYKEAIIKLAKEQKLEFEVDGAILSIDELIEKEGSFEATLKRGWLSAGIMSTALEDITAKTRGLTNEQLDELGYTRKQIDALEKLNEEVQNGSTNLQEFTDKMQKSSGRENLIDALRNSFNALMNVLAPIKEAFREVFPAYTGEQLYKLTENIRKLTEKFVLSDEATKNIKSTFKGLFSILDIGVKAISLVINIIKKVAEAIWPASGGLLKLTATVGNFFTALNDNLDKNEIFAKALENIGLFIEKISTKVKGFVSSIAEQFGLFGGIDLSSFNSFFDKVDGKMKKFPNIVETLKLIVEKIKVIFSAIGLALAPVGEFLSGMFGGLWDNIKKAFEGATFNDIILAIVDILTGGLVIGLLRLFKQVRGAFSELGSMLEGVTKILDSVRGCFKAYQNELNSKALLNIAIAIALLAGAIIALTFVDPSKLGGAVGTITALFIELVTATTILDKLNKKSEFGAVKAVGAMIAMSIAVVILAAAVKMLGDIDEKSLTNATLAVAFLVAEMTAAAVIISKNSGSVQKGSKGILGYVAIAYAISILAKSVKLLSEIEGDKLKQGMIALGVISAELLAFTILVNKKSMDFKKGMGFLAVASAIKILVDVVEDLGGMKVEVIKQGLIVLGLILAELGLFTRISGDRSNMVSMGVGLVIIAASLYIFMDVMKRMAALPTETIVKGLIAIGASLSVLAVTLRAVPNDLVSKGIGLVIVGAALEIMAHVLEKLGYMGVDEIAKSITTLFLALGVIAGALRAMQNTLAGSAALLVATIALGALVPVLLILGSMSWEMIAKGLVAIAGVFVILGVAGAVLGPLVPVILGIAGAFALLGVAILTTGAGLLLAGLGLTALAAGILALSTVWSIGSAAILASMSGLVMGFMTILPPIIDKLGDVVEAICRLIARSAKPIGIAIKALLLTLIDVIITVTPEIMKGIFVLLEAALTLLAERAPELVELLFDFLIGLIKTLTKKLPELTQAVANLVMALFKGVVDAMKTMDFGVIAEGLAGIELLVGLVTMLAGAALLTPVAMVGVLEIGLLLVELTNVLAAIGAIAQIPGLNWLVNEGGEFLEDVGAAIGKFVGGLLGGAMATIAGQLEGIGSDLSDFMRAIRPFLDGINTITPATMQATKSLVEVILAFTAANIIEGLASWLTGGSSLSDFGEELAKFGPFFYTYYEATKNIKGAVVESTAKAAKALASVIVAFTGADILRGIASFISEGISLADFGEELAAFGPSFRRYYETTKNIKGDNVKASAEAAKALAEVVLAFTGTDILKGLTSWFSTSTSLSEFGQELIKFGPYLNAYYETTKNIKADSVTASAAAARSIAGIIVALTTTDVLKGLTSWFSGTTSLTDFGKDLATFGPYFNMYYETTKGIKKNVVETSTNAALALSGFINSLPKSGGMFDFFTGNSSLTSFGVDLVNFSMSLKMIDYDVMTTAFDVLKKFADIQSLLPKKDKDKITIKELGEMLEDMSKYFSKTYERLEKVDAETLEDLVDETARLITALVDLSTLETGAAKNFSNSLKIIGQTGVKSFLDAISDASSDVKKAAADMLKTFLDEANSKKEDLKKNFKIIIQDIVDAINTKVTQFKESAKTLLGSFKDGAIEYEPTLSLELGKVIDLAITEVNGKADLFYNSAKGLMDSFINGVNSTKTYNPRVTRQSHPLFTAWHNIIIETLNTINKRLTDFYNSGKFMVDGIISGLKNKTKREDLTTAANELALMVKDAINGKLKIASPSKVTYNTGKNVALGLINALKDYRNRVYLAGYNIAEYAKNGLRQALIKINDFMLGDINTEPSIRPVMDLSNIQSGTNQLYRMIDGMDGYSINGSINAANRAANGMNQSMSDKNLQNNTSAIDVLKKAVQDLMSSPPKKIENTFNIQGSNPREIADEISRILQTQLEREERVWG